MWRAFFLACGAYACMLGVQCLALDKMVLSSRQTAATRFMGINTGMTTKNKEFTPPDWAPWSLISLGAVTVLYSFTLNKSGGH